MGYSNIVRCVSSNLTACIILLYFVLLLVTVGSLCLRESFEWDFYGVGVWDSVVAVGCLGFDHCKVLLISIMRTSCRIIIYGTTW